MNALRPVSRCGNAILLGLLMLAAAGRAEVEISAAAGRMTGDTTYQIGGTAVMPEGTHELYFPISELKFPLDVYVASVGAKAVVSPRLTVTLGLLANVSKDAGHMEDSDWLTPVNQSQLDIFSKSDSTLQAFVGDVALRCLVFGRPSWTLDVGLGVLYQQFSYDCRLIRQWSPSGEYRADAVGDGSIGLTYEVAYTAPYLSMGVRLVPEGRWKGAMRLDLSPVTRARDEDRHLLRDPPIRAEGDYEGTAVRWTGEGRYCLAPRWFLLGRAEYLRIEATGEQRDTENGVWSHTIDAKTTSTQASGFIGVGYGW